MALSYDGSTLAVGGLELFIYPGYVFLYTYQGASNSYILQQTISGSSRSGFGQFLDLSADGTYLLISDSLDLNAFRLSVNPRDSVNIAWIYVRSSPYNHNCNTDNLWKLQAQLVPVDINNDLALSENADLFSKNFALSADGTTVVIGTQRANDVGNLRGSVAIFNRTNNIWEQMYTIEGNTVGATHSFGASVAISENGTYIAIGDFFGFEKKVYLFTRQGTSYNLSAVLSAPVVGFTHRFGNSLSLSGDGTVLVIGEGNLEGGFATGGIHIAVRGPNNSWTQPFMIQEATNTNLGVSTQCSGNGAFIITGAPFANSLQGQVLIFSPVGSFIPNDTMITGTLCVYQQTKINAPLHVAGDIHLNHTIVTGTGLVASCAAILSDKRTKDNITRLDPMAALEKLRSLQPITFFWKDTTHNAPSQQIGFIAQHMQTIFSHWVSNAPAAKHEKRLLNENKKYIVTIKAELYAHLIAALEQLAQRNAEQKKAIAELQQRKNSITEPF